MQAVLFDLDGVIYQGGQAIDGTVALFVPEATQVEFSPLRLWEGDPEQQLGAVVIGGLGEDWSFARLNQAFRCMMQQPRPKLVALGMTRFWKTPGGLQLDVGKYTA